MKLTHLQNDFASEIRMMIAGNFDRMFPKSDSRSAAGRMDSANHVAKGIAKKMVEIAETVGDEMNEQTWRKVVQKATADAVLRIGDSAVDVGQAPGFAEAVAESTASLLAPADSEWALGVKKRLEEPMRAYLAKLGIPGAEIERLVEDYHLQVRALKNSR